MHATTITGYTYKADLHCPKCIRTMAAYALAGDGEAAFMGRPTDGDTTEQFLDRWAAQEGINRGDEDAFDSDDFPKVVFETGDANNECCGTCYDRLDGNVICRECAEHGIFRCRETVATCDRCKVYKDVFMEMDYSTDENGVPADTVCLDCLATGEHLKNGHRKCEVHNCGEDTYFEQAEGEAPGVGRHRHMRRDLDPNTATGRGHMPRVS